MKVFSFLCCLVILFSCEEVPRILPPEAPKPCNCSNSCWNTVGSIGIVDEKSTGFVNLGRIRPEPIVGEPNSIDSREFTYEDMSAHLPVGVKPGKYSVRYAIPPMSSVLQGTNSETMSLAVIYKITDKEKDKITVYLKEYDLFQKGDYVKIVATFRSSDYSNNEINKYMIENQDNQCRGFTMSIGKLYFIEAILETNRTPSGTTPGGLIGEKIIGPSLAAIEICPFTCIK